MLVGAVFVRFHTLNGLNPGTALLVMMASVKLLETFTQRDQYIVLGGSLFLLLAACLDRQGLLRTPLYLLEAWLCCAAFASVAYSAETTHDPTGAGQEVARGVTNLDPLRLRAPRSVWRPSRWRDSTTARPCGRRPRAAVLDTAGGAVIYILPAHPGRVLVVAPR